MGDLDKSNAAKKVGQWIGKKALEKNIQRVVFDRNGFLYHGRIKALADGARESGLVVLKMTAALSRGDGEEGLKRVDAGRAGFEGPRRSHQPRRQGREGRTPVLLQRGRRRRRRATGTSGRVLGRRTRFPTRSARRYRTPKRSLIVVPLIDGTIPYGVTGEFGASKVIIRPASPGTGVIAGGGVRAVIESQRDLEHPDEVPGEQQSPQPRQGDDRRAFPVADRRRRSWRSGARERKRRRHERKTAHHPRARV